MSSTFGNRKITVIIVGQQIRTVNDLSVKYLHQIYIHTGMIFVHTIDNAIRTLFPVQHANLSIEKIIVVKADKRKTKKQNGCDLREYSMRGKFSTHRPSKIFADS